MDERINIAKAGTELRVEFPIPAGRGAYHVRLDQIKGTREKFIGKERGYLSGSYPMLFKNGNDLGEKILAAIWDTQNPPKPEKPAKKAETDEMK
jgi:hypothetical protein